MPQAAPKPCSAPGCGVLVRDGSSRCEAHKVVAGRWADAHRGSRHERGYDAAWVRRRARILKRDAGICQHCKREHGFVHAGTEVDHIVPKAEGGSDDDANLQTICRDAHRAKTAAEAARGRSEVGSGSARRAGASEATEQGWGGEILGGGARGTEPPVKFLRAGNPGRGGIPTVDGEGA